MTVEEEIMEKDTNKAIFEGNAQSCDIMNDIIKEEAMEEKGTLVQIDFTRELRIADEVEVILGDYEFVLKDGKTYFVKKNKYPKTYEECCKVLDWNHRDYDRVGYESDLLCKLQVLLLCRDAYWKIAGEEMGLDKPWKQDYDDKCFIIVNSNGDIRTYEYYGTNNIILAFPTAEMRDVFYDNFKELIEFCKELL